jgi:hypothetical protein
VTVVYESNIGLGSGPTWKSKILVTRLYLDSCNHVILDHMNGPNG